MLEQAGIEAGRVLKEESYISFSDIGRLFKNGTLISPDELPEEVRRAISSVKIKVRQIPVGEGFETVSTYQYRFWDKGSSLQRLERHLGIQGAEEVKIDLKEKLIERLKAARKRSRAACKAP